MDVLRASCLCGGVQFELPAEFEGGGFCHCTTCKRLSGGVGTANAAVKSEAIRILAGRELLRSFQPSEGSAKSLCSVCVSNLIGGGWQVWEMASFRLPA